MNNNRKLVSLFSGALGLDLGIKKAGFNLISIVECDSTAMATAKLNLKGLEVQAIDEKMSLDNITSICESIMSVNNLRPGELDVLAGAPPCQPFSTAGKRQSISDDRGDGFSVFFKAIKLLSPQNFVIENVKGLVSSAITHRPLSKRGAGFPPLLPEEEYGSAFYRILQDLRGISEEMGYCISWGVLNAADFGAPQSRERLIVIGSLDGKFIWPEKTHSKIGGNSLKIWKGVGRAIKGLKEQHPEYREFNPTVKEFLRLIPEGGNWRSLPDNLHEAALGGAYNSWGGRSGFLRRLSFDKPSPTITQSPASKATMLCHPVETRPLTLRECASIQGFPESWEFCGGLSSKYKQVGNATPVQLAEAIGTSIAKAGNKNKVASPGLFCAQEELLNKIIKRPKTMLNPPGMRKVSDPDQTKKWLENIPPMRNEFSEFKVYGQAL